MRLHSLSHLTDPVLLRNLATLVAKDRATTADLLAHLAEVDARQLYRPAGYASMYSYCVHELHFSDDSAYKRIQAARAAHRYPAILAAIADGRLHLSAVVLLSSCLTPTNADELIAAASHRTKARMEEFLAERFPRPELPARTSAVPNRVNGSAPAAEDLHAPELNGTSSLEPVHSVSPGPNGSSSSKPADTLSRAAPGDPWQLAPGRVELNTFVNPAGLPSRVAPLSPGHFSVTFTMETAMHNKLLRAQTLLRNQVRSGDLAEVFHRALDVMLERLEKRKVVATQWREESPPAATSRRPRALTARTPATSRRT
jgi:hypothetical protein